MGENGGGGGSGTAVHAEGRTADLDDLGAAVAASAALSECKRGAGEIAGRGGDGLGAVL